MTEFVKGELKVSTEYGDNCIIVDSKDNEICDVCPNDLEPDKNKIDDNQFWFSGVKTKATANELVRRWNAFEEGGLVDELRTACEMANEIDSVDNGALYKEWKKKLLVKLEAALAC